MQGFLKQPKPKPGTRSDNQSRNEDHRGKRAKVFEAGHLGSAISSSFAHASHWRQAAANCIFASSSVDARPSVRMSSGFAENAVERPEPALVFAGPTFLIDTAHRPLAAIDGVILPILVDRREETSRPGA
jgi:hypothetical protein